MQPLGVTQPPRPSLLARAAPTLLGVVGGISGAMLGSILPGAGTVVGAVVGSTVGSGVGSLFREAGITADWQRELAGLPGRLEGPRAEALQDQLAVAGFGNYGTRPGALGIPVPGLQGEALQKFLR